jgi:hypothetical protein
MSSTIATRATRPTRPAVAPRPASMRSVDDRAGAAFGRSGRPVLRIVADDECAPVVTRVGPTSPAEALVGRFSPVELVETPLRRVCLDEFFAVDGESQQLKLQRSTTVRLTRRGRLVVLGAALVATLGLGVVWASGSVATDHAERTHVVVVHTGQTLWDISAQVAAGGDVRATMSHLEQINHLDSTVLQAGQHLRIPR